ncbi:MAG: DUF2314 domain-containing protein, partial [bacterium]
MKILIIGMMLVLAGAAFLLMRRGVTTSPLERVTAVPDNDPEMDAAIQKARQTLPSFVVSLQTPTTGDRHLLVKARFVEGANSEHMWVADLI